MPLSVSVTGLGTTFALSTFSYTLNQSPTIEYIFPTVSSYSLNSKIYWVGYHRIYDLGNVSTSGSFFIYLRQYL